MNLLVDIDDVKTRLGINPATSYSDPAIQSGLVAAHLRVEAEMESRFDKQSNTDVFFLDSTQQNIIPQGFFRLKLRNGFVRQSPSIVVSCIEDLTNTGLTPAVVPSTDCLIDYQRGILRLPATYDRQYVTVSYDSGFDPSDSPSLVPDWLQEAILGYVPVLLNFSQLVNNDQTATQVTQLDVQHSMSVLAPYRRNIGFCFRPM